MKFSITDFFGKCDQIHKKLPIWSHLLKKSLLENFIFCAVHILNIFEFLTVCVTFLKPPCQVNLSQIFILCCSFNSFEWFLIFFNKFFFLYRPFFLSYIDLLYVYNKKVSELMNDTNCVNSHCSFLKTLHF